MLVMVDFGSNSLKCSQKTHYKFIEINMVFGGLTHG